MDAPLYGPGARGLQDAFDSRRLADRLDELTVHAGLDEGDRALISRQNQVCVSTVDLDGWPDVSYKGGAPGFVRVTGPSTLELPSYDGNGMFRSAGNLRDTGRIALLFVDITIPWRLRLQGTAEVLTDPETCAAHTGAQLVVRVTVTRAFPNCGRYIHDAATGTLSPHVPAEGQTPPEAEWKTLDLISPYLPGTGT